AAQAMFARPENRARADIHVCQLSFPAIFPDQFLLFQFPKAVGIESLLRRLFQRAGFIEQSAAFQRQVGVDSEGTDIDEPFRRASLKESIHEIACCERGVHEGTGKRLVYPGGEMKDDRDPFSRLPTILR